MKDEWMVYAILTVVGTVFGLLVLVELLQRVF